MTNLPPALLDAIAFAARSHRHQLRKDNQTPYVSHVFRVCMITRHVFGVEDPEVLMAAVLHDTVEDTTTDRDDLIEQFGPRVAEWVAALSKDKRLPDDEREAAYMRTLSQAPWQVKICKLADIYDNLSDSASLTAKGKQKALRRARGYLEALRAGLPEQIRVSFETVSKLLADMETSSS